MPILSEQPKNMASFKPISIGGESSDIIADNTQTMNFLMSAKAEELQQQLEDIDIVKAYSADTESWNRRSAFSLITNEYRVHHLTAGSLRGDDKLGVSPALFQSIDETQVLSVLHVGKALCGHPNITHGGLLATLLDEITALTAIPNLPGKTGFTANLNINYRHPCIADQFIVAHSEITSVEGRKAF
ncbi:hypothetical protein BG011_001837, partial [Mortierella polycephala]